MNFDNHSLVMSLSRRTKRAILVFADIGALLFALWCGFALRYSEWWPAQSLESSWPLFLFVPLFGVAVFVKLGLYRAVIRFMNVRVLWSIALGVLLIIVAAYAFVQLAGIRGVPRSVPIIFGLTAWLYLGGSRLLIRAYYHWLTNNLANTERVVIYGAGGAGVQLAMLLKGGAEYVPVAFVDDDKNLWKGQVLGLTVFSPSDLAKVVEDKRIDVVLLALPNTSDIRRREILESVSKLPVHVKTMPSMPEIIAGDALDNLREVEIEDLLGRDSVAPVLALMSLSIAGKNVCITGAGGSIGSEIARQAVNNGARRVVLYEQSEFALYTIEQELLSKELALPYSVEIVPVLGSVLDPERVSMVYSTFDIHTVYHAAAYKHVPLVEQNVIQGVSNNVLGTRVVAEAAAKSGVERFVLISTDKAVRPTNVMGATKRLAELILQNLGTQGQGTVFSIVRFGNVLGSSGSVVPLFRKQIEIGGPVTVTHPDINRYFMTIPEAASLVIQAGSMAQGGEVFVLDMGDPVRIFDLAKTMIRLSGRTIKNTADPSGDIEIVFSGLRPGEKLYEELLIGDNVIQTSHKKIRCAQEEKLSVVQLNLILDECEQAISGNDTDRLRALLQQAVSGFKPSSSNIDWLRATLDDDKQLINKLH